MLNNVLTRSCAFPAKYFFELALARLPTDSADSTSGYLFLFAANVILLYHAVTGARETSQGKAAGTQSWNQRIGNGEINPFEDREPFSPLSLIT